MRFLAIMRDRRGFIHKRLIGAATGFFGGGGIPGAIGGFLGGGGGGGPPMPVRPRGRLPGGFGGGPVLLPPPPPTFAPPTFTRFTGPMATSVFGGATPGLIPPTTGGPCFPGFKLDPVSQRCVLDVTPGPGTGLPGVPDPQATGMVQPTSVCIDTMVCPQFADGKKGVLWMSALTGLVVCLPRGVNGSGFGLIRKNRPRRKAFVTAAEMKRLQGQATTRKKAKKFAALTGQVCTVRTRAPRRAHKSDH